MRVTSSYRPEPGGAKEINGDVSCHTFIPPSSPLHLLDDRGNQPQGDHQEKHHAPAGQQQRVIGAQVASEHFPGRTEHPQLEHLGGKNSGKGNPQIHQRQVDGRRHRLAFLRNDGQHFGADGHAGRGLDQPEQEGEGADGIKQWQRHQRPQQKRDQDQGKGEVAGHEDIPGPDPVHQPAAEEKAGERPNGQQIADEHDLPRRHPQRILGQEADNGRAGTGKQRQ